MAYMTPEQWAEYEEVINNWQTDAFQQTIFLRKHVTIRDYDGEDHNQRFEDIPLKGLLQYNYFRAWPVNAIKDSGEIDKESMVVFFNIKYLKDNNLADANGQFLFDRGYDRFVLNGLVYKAMGDTQVAQSSTNPLFVFIVLKREELDTGTNQDQ